VNILRFVAKLLLHDNDQQ